MVAPTAIRSSEPTGYSGDRQSAQAAGDDLANIPQLTRGLSGGGNPGASGATAGRGLLPPAENDDYNGQNEQSRKQAFLETAAAHQTDDYLRSTCEAPLSSYEIKAGWEIPALLEQGLNSDLPGELKALVTVNVYDTATGQFLLIRKDLVWSASTIRAFPTDNLVSRLCGTESFSPTHPPSISTEWKDLTPKAVPGCPTKSIATISVCLAQRP
jgi:hypothetical protein